MKSLLRRRGVLINGALAVLLVGGAGVAYFSLSDDAGASSPGRTVQVSRGTVVASVSASGAVASARSQDLSFATSGTVDKINVQVGDKVKKGQVLATVDDANARDDLEAARAALNAAEAGDTSTASGYSSYMQAKTSYNSAQRALDGTELVAPFSGTIVAVNGTVGGSSSGSSSSSSSSSGSSGSSGSGGSGAGGAAGGSSGSAGSSSGSGGGFMTIAETSKLVVTGDFTEADVAKLKKGQSATVTFDAVQSAQASGKVTAIDQTATTSNNVVQYGVTVSLTDPPAGLRIGATATVRVTTARAENVLYVPTAAVRTAGGRSTVTVLRGGKQVVQVVQAGVQGDQGTEITSGLKEGDQVLIALSSTAGSGGFPSGRFPGAGGGVGGGFGGTRGGGRG
ncbi:HlyD family efflux transporter periplasmic adaptor subunit [Actinoallomurus sp. NPDC052308]|uniref:efflux RND transporter periplasmic adaptor subunit n=1 Tax=Actinoallomurus sp. NPDC052308 TaxID=3155530 RepID=UPI003430ABC2